MILNHKKIFVFIWMDNKSHPKLKTEEYLIISIILILFNCRILPIPMDRKIKNSNMAFFCSMTKYNGASFCQVINMVSWYFFMLFLIFTNHSWNGEAAIFIINDIVIMFWVSIEFLMLFVCIDIIIKMPDVIDWMIKYFMLHSIILLVFFWGVLSIPQKAIVFISSVIQIMIQEFLAMHSGGVTIKVMSIKLFVLILL